MKASYPVITTDAFILHTTLSNEADRYLRLITERCGVVDLYARGIRKEEAKLRTVALPYRYVQVSFVVGNKNILKDITVKDMLSTIWDNEKKYTAFVSLLRYLYKLLPTTDCLDSSIYTALAQATKALNSEEVSPDLVCLATQISILSTLGYVEEESDTPNTFEACLSSVRSSERNREKIEKSLKNALLHY